MVSPAGYTAVVKQQHLVVRVGENIKNGLTKDKRITGNIRNIREENQNTNKEQEGIERKQ